jgi:hypothetical protein
MEHAGQKAQCLHSANRPASQLRNVAIHKSAEIDPWRNVQQLDRHHVENFIALSCRDGPAAQSLGDTGSKTHGSRAVFVMVSPTQSHFGRKS